jgi:hypothetical protein
MSKLDNQEIETMHNQGCDRACFNPEHVKPGTHAENMKDHIHHNTLKEVCPKCKGEYTIIRIRTGPLKGKTRRRCKNCRRLKYASERFNS